ncbi:MAG: DNA polymerase III subunit gamma/tau [Spirochaetia bacterium]|nr:DNA polymerase III subunit gamma/tau [Spirochaetia bacterium]
MPYEVTASRKRPQIFEQLAGQEFVAATLEKSIETGRIAHAYLFSGPRGCGKTSTARILAKALNCESGPTPHPCGTCDSCRSITAGSSLDVIEIDGASNTSVDNIRQIKDEVLFPPNSSRYKIYIIDEVHMLSTSAFNALLKTIEEPPPYVVFMFATTEPQKVPATIKSRCQQFTFRLVSPETVKNLLAAAAGDLGVTAEEEALLWIARESGGSIRDAYTLFDQIVSFAEGNITSALIREKLGLVGQDRMNALYGEFVAGNTAEALANLDAILSGGVSPEQFLTDAVEYARALLMIKAGVTREGVLGAPISSFDLGIAEALSTERVERLLSIFLSAWRTLKDSVDPRYELDLAVAKASHIMSYVPPSDLVRAVSTLRRFLEKGGASASSAPSASTAPRGASAAGGTAQKAVPSQGAAAASGAAPASSAALASSDAAAQTSGAAPSERRSAKAPSPVPGASGPAQTLNSGSGGIASAQVPNSSLSSGPAQTAAGRQPLSLADLKKSLVAAVRKSNIMLSSTIEKTRPWRMNRDVLIMPVNTQMEADLLKRYLGIIAEIVAQLKGAPQKIEITFGPDEDAELSAMPEPPNIEDAGSEKIARAGTSQDQPRSFNDASPASRAPSPAAAPSNSTGVKENQSLTLEERESIQMLERFFKGKLVGITAAPAGIADAPIKPAGKTAAPQPSAVESDPETETFSGSASPEIFDIEEQE